MQPFDFFLHGLKYWMNIPHVPKLCYIRTEDKAPSRMIIRCNYELGTERGICHITIDTELKEIIRGESAMWLFEDTAHGLYRVMSQMSTLIPGILLMGPSRLRQQHYERYEQMNARSIALFKNLEWQLPQDVALLLSDALKKYYYGIDFWTMKVTFEQAQAMLRTMTLNEFHAPSIAGSPEIRTYIWTDHDGNEVARGSDDVWVGNVDAYGLLTVKVWGSEFTDSQAQTLIKKYLTRTVHERKDMNVILQKIVERCEAQIQNMEGLHHRLIAADN